MRLVLIWDGEGRFLGRGASGRGVEDNNNNDNDNNNDDGQRASCDRGSRACDDGIHIGDEKKEKGYDSSSHSSPSWLHALTVSSVLNCPSSTLSISSSSAYRAPLLLSCCS